MRGLVAGAVSVLAVFALPATALAGAGPANVTVNDDAIGSGPSGANCGAADFTTMQSAIDAATAGDTIFVCAGNYDEDVTLNKTGLTLRGAQAGNDAKDRAGNDADESTLDGTFALTSNDGAVNGFTVENADSVAFGGIGIALGSGTGDHLVSNNIVQNNVFGLSLANEVGVTVIRRNQFNTNNEPGAASGNGIYGDFGSQDVEIDKNGFAGNNNGDVLLTGVNDRNSDIEITNNESASSRGIYVGLTDRVRIAGNSVNSTDSGDGNGAFSAIVLAGAVDDAVIEDNDVTGASTAVRIGTFFFATPNKDIQVLGNTLVDNTGPFGYGIRGDDGGFSGDIEAHGNRIVGNTTGIANQDDGEFIDGTRNWFGCNDGAGAAGCDTVAGAVNAEDNLTLSFKRKSNKLRRGEKMVIPAKINGGEECLFPDDTPIAFATTRGKLKKPTDIVNCQATVKLKATKSRGRAKVTATLDNETEQTKVRFKPKN